MHLPHDDSYPLKDILPKLSLVLLLALIKRYEFNSQLRKVWKWPQEIKYLPNLIRLLIIVNWVSDYAGSHRWLALELHRLWHIAPKQYFLVLYPGLSKVIGLKRVAKISLCSELSMRLKMIDVNLLVSDNKTCHPSLESCCLALRSHLLLPHLKRVLNLLNDAIYHGWEPFTESHHKANVFSEQDGDNHVLEGFIEIELLSDPICEETFHLLSISDAEP